MRLFFFLYVLLCHRNSGNDGFQEWCFRERITSSIVVVFGAWILLDILMSTIHFTMNDYSPRTSHIAQLVNANLKAYHDAFHRVEITVCIFIITEPNRSSVRPYFKIPRNTGLCFQTQTLCVWGYTEVPKRSLNVHKITLRSWLPLREYFAWVVLQAKLSVLPNLSV